MPEAPNTPPRGTPPSSAPPDQLPSGSHVKLKSGGPLMTVLRDGYVGSERKVHCSWFDTAGAHYHELKVPRAAVAASAAPEIFDRVAQHVFDQAEIRRAKLEAIVAVTIGDLDPAAMIAEIRTILAGPP